MSKVTDVAGKGRPGTSFRNIALYGVLALIVLAIVYPLVLARRFDKKPLQNITSYGGVHVGDTAPAFFTVTTNGVPVGTRYSGSKPILLELFATWCVYCQRAVPALNQLFDEYHNRVLILAVNGSTLAADKVTLESASDVRTFGRKYKAHFPLAWDRDLYIANHYLQQAAFPTYIVISRSRRIAYYAIGESGIEGLPPVLKHLF